MLRGRSSGVVAAMERHDILHETTYDFDNLSRQLSEGQAAAL